MIAPAVVTTRALLRTHLWRAGAILLALGPLAALQGARADDLPSVPGADTGEPRSVSVNIEYDGASGLRSTTALWLFSAGYDVSDRVSLGADLLLTKGTRRTTVLSPNGSYLFLKSSRGLRGRAGFANVGVRSFGEQPYVTFAQSVSRTDLLAGWTRDSGHDRLMLGVEGRLSARWSGVADWITGSGNFMSAGARFHFSGDRALTLAYLRANSSGDEDGVYLSYGFSWKPGGGKESGRGNQPSGAATAGVAAAGTAAAASSRSSALK